MIARGLVCIALALLAGSAWGAEPAERVRYTIQLETPAQGTVQVKVDIAEAPAPLELVFPAWLPGAYELRYFGKNVRNLVATDADHRALAVRVASPTRVLVDGHRAGTPVSLHYTMAAPLFSDDGAEATAAHVYLNPGAILPLVRGLENRACSLTLDRLPVGWHVVAAFDEGQRLRSTSYAALIDNPIEAAPTGDLQVSTRTIAGAQFVIAMHAERGPQGLPPSLWSDLERLVQAEQALAGPLPFSRYFLFLHVSDRPGRAVALEHAAATSVLAPRAWMSGDGYTELRHMIAHELFHAWNARRLIPATLATWDPERPQASPELWITEGLTEHAALTAQTRAGMRSGRSLAEALSLALTRARRAERAGCSLEELSRRAFSPPPSLGDDPDAYYAIGHLVSLALVAELLRLTDGKAGLPELLAALLPPRGAPPRTIDRERLGRALDGLLPPGAPPLSATLERWVTQPFQLAPLLPSLEAAGLRVGQRGERGLTFVDPASLAQPRPASQPKVEALRTRLLGIPSQ